MNATWTHRDDGFVIGRLTGAWVGAGLAIWLAPRLASVLRQRVFDSARNLGQRAAEQYQHVGTHVGCRETAARDVLTVLSADIARQRERPGGSPLEAIASAE